MKTAMIALVAVALLLVSTLALQGWMTFGAEIFLAMTETGLSWCF